MEPSNIKLKILRMLLDSDEDVSVREIARRVDLPSSHVFYHLKALAQMGVLVREQVGDRVYYTPQPMFTDSPNETLAIIHGLLDKIKEPNDEKLANCLFLFLQCYNDS